MSKKIPDGHTDLDCGSSLESSEINLLVGRHGEWALNGDRAAAFGTSNLTVGRSDTSDTFLNREREEERKMIIDRSKYTSILQLPKISIRYFLNTAYTLVGAAMIAVAAKAVMMGRNFIVKEL